MVRRSRAPLLAASLIACGLAGCSSVTPVATNVDTPGMPNAEVALQKSMDETAGELARIGAMQPAAAVASQPTVVPGELERVVAMSWNGALDGAVKKLADGRLCSNVPMQYAIEGALNGDRSHQPEFRKALKARDDRLPRRRQRQCVAGDQCRRRSGSTAGLRHSS